MPATWTAAGLSFLVAPTLAGTYGSAYDEGAEITIASAGVVAGRTILFSDALATKLRAVRFLKLRSGAAGAPGRPRPETSESSRLYKGAMCNTQ